MLTLRNSSARTGMSNLFALYPARSHPSRKVVSFFAISLNAGEFATSLSVMPWIAVDFGGIGISGFTLVVNHSSVPFGDTLRTEISTILSVTILMPVVSRSRKAIDRLSLRSILCVYHHWHQEHKKILRFVLTPGRQEEPGSCGVGQ